MGIGVLAIMVLGSLFAVGAWLILRGVRGEHIPAHRVCRACKFDLSGLEPELCPECGVGLTDSKAVRVIRRRPNPRQAFTGLAMVAAALAVPASVLIDSAMSGRLSAVLPTWMLSVELRVMGSRTPPSVSDQLFDRFAKGEVSDSTLRVVATAISEMRTSDESVVPSLNLLVGAAAAKGVISKDVLASHVITRQLLEAQVPERLWADDPVVTRLVNYSNAETRVPRDGVWIVSKRIRRVEIDGVRHESRPPKSEWEANDWAASHTYIPSGGAMGVSSPAWARQSAAVPAAPTIAPGRHIVRLCYVVEVFNGPTDSCPGQAEAFKDYSIEVMAADAPLVTVVEDEAFKEQIASRIRLQMRQSSGPGSPAGWYITLKETPGRPSPLAFPDKEHARVGGAWDVLIEIGGERQKMGKYKVGWRADAVPYASMWAGHPKVPSGVNRCRIILVPDERYAAEREAVDVMPAGEMVFEDLPIW